MTAAPGWKPFAASGQHLLESACPWPWARFNEYKNTGSGAGTGANAPQLSDSDAADYTAQKYLAGTDGWNPVS